MLIQLVIDMLLLLVRLSLIVCNAVFKGLGLGSRVELAFAWFWGTGG